MTVGLKSVLGSTSSQKMQPFKARSALKVRGERRGGRDGGREGGGGGGMIIFVVNTCVLPLHSGVTSVHKLASLANVIALQSLTL